MYMKKSRGQKRRLKKLLKNIDEFVPFEYTDTEFEHFHVPSTPWIEVPKTSGKIKTAFARKWLEKTEQFIDEKPKDIPFCRVVALICEPYLWDSQIILFYSEDYYRTFWNRKGPYQTWTAIEDKSISYIRPRGIESSLQEKGYCEVLADEDYTRRCRLWYFGELPGTDE